MEESEKLNKIKRKWERERRSEDRNWKQGRIREDEKKHRRNYKLEKREEEEEEQRGEVLPLWVLGFSSSDGKLLLQREKERDRRKGWARWVVRTAKSA